MRSLLKKIGIAWLFGYTMAAQTWAQTLIYPNAAQNQPPIVIQQDPKSKLVDQIIEGSKVMVDLVKVFAHPEGKDKKSTDNCELQQANLCFENKGTSIVKVELQRVFRTEEETEEQQASSNPVFVLVVPVGEKECTLKLKKGFYIYTVYLNEGNKMVRKGELQLNPCKDLVKELKK